MLLVLIIIIRYFLIYPRSGRGATVLEYLHLQVSSTSCKVVGSILALLGKTIEKIVVIENSKGAKIMHSIVCGEILQR